jgi:hypothetical protein
MIFTWLFTIGIWGQEWRPATKLEPAAKPEIIATATLDSVQQIIQGMGFECAQFTDDAKSEPYLSFRAEGYKFDVGVPTPDSIWIYTIFNHSATLQTINEWNQNSRFSRASVAPTGRPLLLDTEIVVAGGVTRENIEMQIKTFRDSVARWARFVLSHQVDPKKSLESGGQ